MRHHQYPLETVSHKIHVVQDGQHQLSPGLQASDDLPKLRLAQHILGNGGLVQNHHLGVHGQHRGDGHQLPLRKLQIVGVAFRLFGQPHLHQGLPGLFLRRFLRHADIERPEHHLIQHLVLKNLIIRILEHVTDTAAELCHRMGGNVFTAKVHAAALGLQKSLQYSHQRGFSGAVLSDDGRGPVIQRQAEARQHRLPRNVGELQIFCPEAFRQRCFLWAFRCLFQRRRQRIAKLRFSRRRHCPKQRLEGNGIAAVVQLQFMRPGEARVDRRLHMAALQIVPGEDLLGRADGENFSVLHQQQTVAVGSQLLRLLFNHQDGNAGFRQLLHDAENLFGTGGIQLGGGLVEDQKLRLHGQHRCNGHALQLSAGKVEGIPVPEFPDAQLTQHRLYTLTDLLRCDAQILQTVAHLVKDGVLGAGQLVKGILEDQSDFLTERTHRCFGRLPAIDPHGAAIGALIELGNQPEQRLGKRAFAGAVFAHETDEFALFRRKGNVIQGQTLRPRITVFEMFYFDESHKNPILPRMLSSSANSDRVFTSLSCLE